MSDCGVCLQDASARGSNKADSSNSWANSQFGALSADAGMRDVAMPKSNLRLKEFLDS